jgi:hypothetical protein
MWELELGATERYWSTAGSGVHAAPYTVGKNTHTLLPKTGKRPIIIDS